MLLYSQSFFKLKEIKIDSVLWFLLSGELRIKDLSKMYADRKRTVKSLRSVTKLTMIFGVYESINPWLNFGGQQF